MVGRCELRRIVCIFRMDWIGLGKGFIAYYLSGILQQSHRAFFWGFCLCFWEVLLLYHSYKYLDTG